MAHQFWLSTSPPPSTATSPMGGTPSRAGAEQQPFLAANEKSSSSSSHEMTDRHSLAHWDRYKAPMASVEYMEEQQQQQQASRLATFTIAESPATTANMLAPSPLAGQQFHTVRMGAAPGAGHETDGLSPALPSLVHLPLCRASAAVSGLRYRNLGKSGLRVSNVGLGTWVTFGAPISEDVAEEIVVMAFESGINVFDLSDGYCGPRAEQSLGRILRQRRWRRSSYVVITKVYWSYRSEERGLSRKHIIESVRGSLERLQLDYIDVVLIHRADPMCPMEEVVRAMSHVIDHGWAMYWGTSRWSAVEISEAYNNCRQFNCPLPICEQAEYHFLCREKVEISLPEVYNKLGVGLMTWSPLTMGFAATANKGEESFANFHRMSFKKKFSTVTWPDEEAAGAAKENAYVSRMSSEEAQRQSGKLREISQMAERFGCTPSQLAIAWSLRNEHVHSVLIGAVSPEQLYEHLQALQIVPKLSGAVMMDLERVLDNKPVRPPMISTLAMR